MTNLTTLSRRVSEADGPSAEIDVAVATACSAWVHVEGRWPSCPPFTASLDAVAALIAEKLPGLKWSIHKSGSPYIAGVTKEAPVRTMPHMGVAKTPALALLSAALLAIHERNKSDE